VNILHVSVAFCGHLQGGISKDILQRQPRQSKLSYKLSIKRHLSEDGHKRWPNQVGGLQQL
jgi:hypothetical protein